MSFEIGTTYAGRVNVETLSASVNMAPRSLYKPYAESVVMASGKSVGRGSPSAIWSWGYVPADMFAALRILCPGASASMYIRTLIADYATYAYYTCIMTWPAIDSYEYRAGVYQPFSIEFSKLVSYTP
jgi:hypothetical protein